VLAPISVDRAEHRPRAPEFPSKAADAEGDMVSCASRIGPHGMNPRLQQHVFERFSRGDQSRQPETRWHRPGNRHLQEPSWTRRAAPSRCTANLASGHHCVLVRLPRAEHSTIARRRYENSCRHAFRLN